MSSSAVLGDVATAFTTFVDDFTAVLAPMWATEVQISELILDQLDASGKHNVAQERTAVTIKGSGGGVPLDPRTSVVIGLRTALPTRSGRGRMYWVAPDDTHLTATGLLASTDAASLASGMSTALNTLSGTATPVIFHRASATFTPITTVSVGQVLGTQRRRTNKVPDNYQYSTV